MTSRVSVGEKNSGLTTRLPPASDVFCHRFTTWRVIICLLAPWRGSSWTRLPCQHRC